MSWYTSGQEDQNVRYFLLNSAHGSYETKRAVIEALSPNYQLDDGNAADTKVVRGYVTDAEIASNSLDIGGAVLDRVHNFVNPYASTASIRTNAWGDKFRVWGQFLQQPDAISTTGIDRLVQHWKDGLGNAVYIGQENAGTGDGSSYANRRRVRDFLDLFSGGAGATVNPTTFDIVVLVGRLSRFINEGPQASLFAGQGIYFKTGTSGSRTQIIGHPVAGASLMGGPKLGSGAHGEAADFTSEGDGIFSLVIVANSGPGGADLALSSDQHVMSDAGGTLRALYKYTSLAALQAAAEGYFIQQNYSGSNDRIYVKLSDGSNPKHTTYFGEAAAGGVQFITGDTQYFDVYGVNFYQQAFLGAFHSGVSDFTYHACGFHYVHHIPMFKHNGGFVVEATGLYDQTVGDPDPVPYNRKWIGCEFSHGYVAIYDACGTYIVPVNTTFQDCYLHHFNLLDDFGHTQNFSSSDAHTITCQGCDGWYITNCRLDTIASQPLVIYLLGNNYNTPDPVLAATDGYVTGWGYPDRALDNGDGTWFSPGMCKNVHFSHNLVTNVLTADDDAGYATNGQGIALQGGQALIGILGQFDNIIVEYNVLEGHFTEAAFRTKLSFAAGQTSYPIFRHNICRGADYGFMQIQTTEVNGVSYDPSFVFEHNDVHALIYFVRNTNQGFPANHSQYFDNNTYRNDGSAIWLDGAASTYATLPLWNAAAPSGDTYDTNSTHTALTTDTGSPSLTISGTGTATASLGADPDGSVSSVQYQWRVDGAIIESAEATSFDYSSYPDGSLVDCIAEGVDANGKWFIVASNQIEIHNHIGRSGMFGHRYFGLRYYGQRYFGPAVISAGGLAGRMANLMMMGVG